MANSGSTGPNGQWTDDHGMDGEPTEDARDFGREPGDEPFEVSPETARLPFADEDERLPWLESDDDDEDDYPGVATGQMVGLVAAGLLVLALVVGGIWWATHRNSEGTPVADGAIVAAPAQPYKEAPKDPGGKTFDGTGDTSFAVSEGQTRPARLGQEDVAPKPGFTASPAAPATPAAKTGAPVPARPQPAGGIGVQVGAYSSQSAAEAAWDRLSSHYDALSGLHHRVVEGRADIGTVYRLQAVSGDLKGAQALCSKLKASGLACQVKQ